MLPPLPVKAPVKVLAELVSEMGRESLVSVAWLVASADQLVRLALAGWKAAAGLVAALARPRLARAAAALLRSAKLLAACKASGSVMSAAFTLKKLVGATS